VFITVSEKGPLTFTGKIAYLPPVTGKGNIEIGVEIVVEGVDGEGVLTSEVTTFTPPNLVHALFSIDSVGVTLSTGDVKLNSISVVCSGISITVGEIDLGKGT
jgi:hypothetical protein